MLNLGFAEDIEKIMFKIHEEVQIPPQFLLFSATVPNWVKDVARNYLSKNYKKVDLC